MKARITGSRLAIALVPAITSGVGSVGSATAAIARQYAGSVPSITQLDRADAPEAALRARGLSPYPWSAGAGARFSPHSHSATKHLYVVEGSIDFDGHELRAGEGILIPAHTTHSAVVGAQGVTCVEAFSGD